MDVNCYIHDNFGSKYEEICAPQVEEFCYITDNTYFKEEVCLLSFHWLKCKATSEKTEQLKALLAGSGNGVFCPELLKI